MKWEYKGRPLAHPLTIARRLMAYPLYQTARVLLFLFVWLGWGLGVAKDEWKGTA